MFVDSSGQLYVLRILLLLTFICGVFSGCGKAPKGPPREPTFPITGRVLVDGQPANNLKVTFHPESGKSIGAYTDSDGHFSVGTYEAGDGAPSGTYKLTFEYGQINLMSGRYGGPDKLNGRYADSETSEHTVTVEDGTENDLGEIALTTN